MGGAKPGQPIRYTRIAENHMARPLETEKLEQLFELSVSSPASTAAGSLTCSAASDSNTKAFKAQWQVADSYLEQGLWFRPLEVEQFTVAWGLGVWACALSFCACRGQTCRSYNWLGLAVSKNRTSAGSSNNNRNRLLLIMVQK